MHTMIENYINGNLTDARKQAKRFTLAAIRETLMETYGYSQAKATATAQYLKGVGTFQAACGAK